MLQKGLSRRAALLACPLILRETSIKQRERRWKSSPIGPGFAAELRGVTLTDVAADDETYRQTRAAFEEHSVLVFRDQDVTDDLQLAFSRRFGPLEVTHVAAEGAGTNLVIFRPSTRTATSCRPIIGLRFATKPISSGIRIPPSRACRHLPRCCRDGSCRRGAVRPNTFPHACAWERLDQATQDRIANFFVWHDYSHSRGKISPNLVGASERAALPPRCWRMVWKNPVNGRTALYLASHAYAIEGMEQVAAQKLLAELIDAATTPGLSYEHAWQKGDVVMWDNRATMHRGRPWPADEARFMVRTTISATEADGLANVRPPARQAAE